MQSVYSFVVSPKGSRYNNTKDVDGKKLILNTDIFNHQFTNREAVVLEEPKINNTSIRKGDTVLVHHNVFRRWTDVRGDEKNSKNYFEEDKYIVHEDQIFLYKHEEEWLPMKGFCFIQPIKAKGDFDIDQEEPLKGIVEYTDGTVKKLIKVAKEAIVDSGDDITADRLKNAAATKKLAIFDAFEILNRIQEEENLLEGKTSEKKEDKVFKGFAEGRSK